MTSLKQKITLIMGAVVLASLLAPSISWAAPITLFAPWNEGERWIAGGGCYPGGSYYGEGAHGNGNNDYYAIDFNGIFNENCQNLGNDDGKEIRATNTGTVSAIGQNPSAGYGYYVLLDHGSGVTSRYAHLKYNPTQTPGLSIGQQVSKGQVIGYNGSTGDSSSPHLHFVLYQNGSSIRPDPMDGQSLCDSCEGALILSSNSTSSSSTSWNFTTTNEGWSAVNTTDQGIYASNYWQFDPGIDPQLISPQLSAVNASNYKILKIAMDVPGTGSDTGKVYFKNNINDSWSESKMVSFDINKSDSGQQVYYVQMRDAPNNSWTGQIAQIRIDPVVNYPTDNTGSIYLDSITFEFANDVNIYQDQSLYPTVVAGQNFSIFFTVQNTGNTKWDSGYSLRSDPGVQNNYVLGASNPTYIPSSTAVLPGLGTDSNYTFNLNMSAPLAPGVYRTGWRMAKPDGTFFGAPMFVDVTVKRFPVERADFDGDGKSDVAVYRPSDGYWHILWSSIAGGDPSQLGVIHSTQWGISGDTPVPGDYDGDGKTDIAIYRLNDPWLSNQTYWHIKRSSDGRTTSIQWGLSQTNDVPVPGDYDGDGKTDAAIFRYSDPYNNNQTYWHIKRSSDGGITSVQWGLQSQGDIPAHGDFDGDGKVDIAVYRLTDGYWHILWSSVAGGDQTQPGVIHSVQWGLSGDVPVPGNFDGDTKSDVAIYRPSDGYWHALWSSISGGDPTQPGVIHSTQWGLSGDAPVPGKYDEDMKTDIAIYRPSAGYWHIIKSATGQISSILWGYSTDIPIYDGRR